MSLLLCVYVRTTPMIVIARALMGTGLCLTLAAPARAESDHGFRAGLALRWAPIHEQQVRRQGSHALGGAADFITSIDFDGDLDASNNWENAARFALPAHAYYSVVETASHWYVVYTFYHPRDWSSRFLDTEHENDSEGVLLAIARDGSRYGALRAAVTVVHSDFYSFVPAGSPWRSGQEDIDGELQLRAYAGALHPVTAQQAETHALKAWPYYSIQREGVVYYPSLTRAETPSSADDRSVVYQLHDVLESGGPWQRRRDARLFAGYGTMAGNASGGCGSGVLWCRRDAAHMAWGWNDHDDGVRPGAMASDPAALAATYFVPHEPLAKSYRFNPFR